MSNKKKKKRNDNPVGYAILLLLMGVIAILAVYIAICGSVDAVLYLFAGNSLKDLFIMCINKYKIPLIVSSVLCFIVFILFCRLGFITEESLDDTKKRSRR